MRVMSSGSSVDKSRCIGTENRIILFKFSGGTSGNEECQEKENPVHGRSLAQGDL